MAKELSMNGRKKIGTLQREFTEKFNYLTIIFLDQEMRALDPDKSLSEVRTKKGSDISIVASLKVNTLEQRFRDDFGIQVEVAYFREGRLVHTKETLDKSLNELNAWCAENGCEPVGAERAASAGTLLSIQEQLFNLIRVSYPDAVIKKINTDNFVDIHLPSVHSKKGTHLFFNTAKNEIKFGFFVREEDFVNAVLAGVPSAERHAQGVRPSGNPAFSNVEEAAAAAVDFLHAIISAASKSVAVEKPGERVQKPSAADAADTEAIGVKWVTARNSLIAAIAGKGDASEVRRILSAGGADVNAVDDAEGYTALHYAAWDGYQEILALLLEHNADVDPVGNDGRSPLHLAAVNGRIGCLRILLEHGAKPDRRIRDQNRYHGKRGGTALRDAVLNQLWEVYDVLLSFGADIGVLAEPCADGKDFLSAAKEVAEQYPDVGARYDAARMEEIRKTLRPKASRKPEKNSSVSVDDYLARWQVPTVFYFNSPLKGRIPSWVNELYSACPVLTADEGTAILKSVKSRKLIPILPFAPKAFFNHTKRVWWIVPLVVWKGEVLSWIMMDKNGFYAPHPGKEDVCFIAPFDRVTDYSLEEEEDGLDRLTLIYDNDSYLTIDGFIPEGGASYLKIAHAIMKVRQPTIDASKGQPSWKEGAGGEGFIEFDGPDRLKDLGFWANGEVSRPDPRFFA